MYSLIIIIFKEERDGFVLICLGLIFNVGLWVDLYLYGIFGDEIVFVL